MLAKVFSCTTMGLSPYLVEVEVDVAGGLPNFVIVGLPDTTVKESKERVRTAIKNAGFEFPPRKVIVNLAPADLKKEGPGFDLAIAIGILVATKQLKVKSLQDYVIVGELSLDGRIRRVPGILPMAMFMQSQLGKNFIIPQENTTEAALTMASTYSFDNLVELKHFLENPLSTSAIPTIDLAEYLQSDYTSQIDLSQVKGQRNAKRAIEIAAAGGHNILMMGYKRKELLIQSLQGFESFG